MDVENTRDLIARQADDGSITLGGGYHGPQYEAAMLLLSAASTSRCSRSTSDDRSAPRPPRGRVVSVPAGAVQARVTFANERVYTRPLRGRAQRAVLDCDRLGGLRPSTQKVRRLELTGRARPDLSTTT